MGTLNTSINITSKDTLAFSINQTVKGAGSTGEFAESGVKTVTPLLSSSFATGAGLLSARTCGANGAYVFVENPTTNTNNVELIGATDLNNAVSASGGIFANITGLYSFTTLKPGDSTIVPLTPGQGGVYAYTTSGTSTINYYIADREGAFGQSGLIVTTVGTTYQYAVLDSQAGVLSQGNPTPYFTSIDTGVSSSYSYPLMEITNNKGYALMFTDNEIPDHRIYKFIDNKGQVVGTLDLTDAGEITDNLDQMGGYVVTYSDNGNAIVNYFDGETLYEHSFDGDFNGLADDYQACASDGAFVITVTSYSGSPDNATILINKGNSYVLAVYPAAGDIYVRDVAYSFYSSFIFLTIDDDYSSLYQRFQIWSTNGVLLKDLDIADYEFDNIDYVLYGSNKLQVIADDGVGLDYLLNYNGATNHLIGHNATNPQLPLLNWSHVNTGNYDTRRFYAYGKYPNDSIRTYNYDWNSGVFDAESMAMVYSDAANNESGYHINSEVSYCDIVYVMSGDTTYGVHQVNNNNGLQYIRIPGESGYNRITPSSNLIAFNYSTNSYESGSLQMLAITPTGVNTTTLAPKLEDLDNGNGDIYAIPVGEYIMYRTHNTLTNKTTFTMAKSATKKGSLTLTGTAQDWYRRYNSMILYDYDVERMWYFNTTTNAFVEISNVYNWWDDVKWNLSTTTNGLNDGNQLITPNDLNTAAEAKMRLLKQGTITPEKQLPVTDGNWNIYLGSEAVFLIYQDMNDSYNYKVNVYDFDLNLVKTVPLNTNSTENYNVVGKRFYVKLYNVDQLLGPNYYSYYMISLEGMAYWLHADNDSVQFNDKWWWDYIA